MGDRVDVVDSRREHAAHAVHLTQAATGRLYPTSRSRRRTFIKRRGD